MNTFVRHHRNILKYGYNASSQEIGRYNKYSMAVPSYRPHLALRSRPKNISQLFRGGGIGPGIRLVHLERQAEMLSCISDYRPLGCSSFYTYNPTRNLHLSHRLYVDPSSKVEATVQTMKEKQKEKVEEIMKEAANGAACAPGSTASPDDKKTVATAAAKPVEVQKVVPKKPLKTRIWEECLHYYHGFRLLVIDINICRKLLWRVLNGKTLTRRENKLLVRTTSDLFRLIPFSVFIIVPFLELLLPFFIKFFPGMLPSTFQTAKEREDKLKQSFQVKLEMAKFLQKTLDEMTPQHKEHKSEEAKAFAQFFQKIKDPREHITTEEITKFAKRFEDEITLDSLSREQLAALCRVLELNTMGTTNLLRFQLRVKLRSLAADDRVISREGVNALDLYELQQACKARGMRAYGLTEERLRYQLQEWIDLSLNEKVPPSLLLLSRALLVSDDTTTTTDKLKETIRVLPDAVAAQAKVAIGEREGKIDNKSKIEVMKEQERKIREEREEECEEEKARAEVLLDKAPRIETATVLNAAAASGAAAKPALKPLPQMMEVHADKLDKEKGSISSKDVELLGEALKSLSCDKNKMAVEKERIKDIKEELEDYKEDVEELCEVRNVVQEPVRESRAAKMLFRHVNNMIGKLDKVLVDLEKKHQDLQCTPEEEAQKRKEEELVRIDELVNTIKKLKQTSNESRLEQIVCVLSKLDDDKDGAVTTNDVLKVVEAIGRDNVNLDEKQIEEILALLDKEEEIQAEQKFEKQLLKTIKEARQTQAEETQKAQEGNATKAAFDQLTDKAPVLKDNATDLSCDPKNNQRKDKSSEMVQEANARRVAADIQKEKIIPSADLTSAMPPTIPTPPPPTSKSATPKDKML